MNASQSGSSSWPDHVLRAGNHRPELRGVPKPEEHRDHVEPWLSALFQSEHLSLLVGRGLTTAVAYAAGAPNVNMQPAEFDNEYAGAVEEVAKESAATLGRGEPNIEDQIRAIRDLMAGLRVFAKDTGPAGDESTVSKRAKELFTTWETTLDDVL